MTSIVLRRIASGGVVLSVLLTVGLSGNAASAAAPTNYSDTPADTRSQSAVVVDSRQPALVPSGVELVDGPTYVFKEGAEEPQVSPLAVASLPFNYILDDVSWGIESRRFTTTTGRVCTDLRLWKVRGGTPYTDFHVELWEDLTGLDKRIGSPVAWPVDNRTYSYCWSPVTNNRTYYFWFGYGSGGNYVYVDGSGTARG